MKTMDTTTPWAQEEYISVNNRELAYKFDKGEMIVLFPGGRAEPLHEVQTWAQSVVLPKRLRDFR